MRITKIIVIISLLLSGCFWRDEARHDLSLKRIPYDGNKLQFDGFYYSKKLGQKVKYYSVYFLFRNGILKYVGEHELNDIELRNISIPDMQSEYQHQFGVFQIKDDSIFFERWWPGWPFKVYLDKGIILNDSTFILDIQRYHYIEDPLRFDRIFRFKSYLTKPDSLTHYID